MTHEPTQPVVSLRQAVVRYGGSAAIDGIDFDLRAGEVHALLGENGAGKSTLTKVMAGVVHLSEGEMLVDGAPVSPSTPKDALALGIAMVFQETSLVPTMTVAQNLYLGQERAFNRLRGINIAAQQFLQSLNFDVNPTVTVAMLGAAKRQMVEIARAVLHNVRVIIFDEPTATLTPEEKQHFFKLVKNLKARGVSVIFISHALEEALMIADRITVLRDARHVLTEATGRLDRETIIKAMIGRDLSQSFYGHRRGDTDAVRPEGRRLLSVQNLRMAGVVKNTSFSVFAGQVTGVFGLVGAGRTETFKVVAGALKRNFLHGGEVVLNGRPVRYRTPAPAIRDGIAYITEDRKVEGFFETMTPPRNIHVGKLARSWRSQPLAPKREERQLGETWRTALNIKAVSGDVKVIELSGGNQQKVVIAKSLVQDPDLIIFDEPTRGVDVGAIAEIHEIINRLADAGKGVVVISSYLPEILALSDRILVARQGKIVEEFSAGEADEKKIMYAAIH
ncbi:ABC transporter ATP-binding protein [Zhengella mangrovi]|uniref:ABC transporter ATP-binding protein n=1 Tax=Zhengella mangrovi TaxID=1982044 RepID=A0A2G1QJD7_9HYPH|nr:sugar ABC transporter ATP-binding protein [Zhengella mangrovi]PHP65643.1 ABC transporter ATP-binding protein [Zhengella mangrovi]